MDTPKSADAGAANAAEAADAKPESGPARARGAAHCLAGLRSAGPYGTGLNWTGQKA